MNPWHDGFHDPLDRGDGYPDPLFYTARQAVALERIANALEVIASESERQHLRWQRQEINNYTRLLRYAERARGDARVEQEYAETIADYRSQYPEIVALFEQNQAVQS